MSDLQAAYIAAGAALGASALTGGATWGIDRLREARASKSAVAAARRAIYLEMLSAAGAVMMGFTELRVIGDFSSKWGFGWRQLTKTAPAQPTLMEITSKFNAPMERLLWVQSQALLTFEQDEMDAVNKLMQAAQDFDTSKPPTDSDSVEGRLGAARLEFAQFARTKIGTSAVRLALEASPRLNSEAPAGTGA
jgi:hypothetical protein